MTTDDESNIIVDEKASLLKSLSIERNESYVENNENSVANEYGGGKRSQNIVEILAGLAGNIIEWYDFAIFGYFSDVIGDVMFPPNQGGR